MARNVRDPLMVTQLYNEWLSFPEGSNERGDVVRRYCEFFGVSRTTCHADFNRLSKGDRLKEVVNRKPKTKNISKSSKTAEIAMIVAKIKAGTIVGQNGVALSTEDALYAAIKSGMISQEDAKHRATIDKQLHKMGVSAKKLKVKRISTELIADYPNYCWIADATPIRHYYFNLKDEDLTYDPKLEQKSSHIEQVLERYSLAKIWVYRVVDMYSKSYFQMAYSPKPKGKAKHGGENSSDWLDMLIKAMLEKERIPTNGVPKLLMTDRTCGIHANISKNFLLRLGIENRQRDPENPSAGGGVESRHWQFQRQFEIKIVKSDIHTLEELNRYLTNFMVFDNERKGLYAKWLEGVKTNPIRKVTQKNIHDATVVETDRVVTNYGTVQIKNQHWLVDGDVLPGDKVTVYKNLDGEWCIQTSQGMIYSLVKGKAQRNVKTFDIMDNKGEIVGKTENDIRREEVKRNKIQFPTEFWLPEESNVRYFPVVGEATNTHHAMATDCTSVSDGLSYIVGETGTLKTEDESAVKEALNEVLKEYGIIPREMLKDLVNTLLKTA